jgi:hypothetical protein
VVGESDGEASERARGSNSEGRQAMQEEKPLPGGGEANMLECAVGAIQRSVGVCIASTRQNGAHYVVGD